MESRDEWERCARCSGCRLESRVFIPAMRDESKKTAPMDIGAVFYPLIRVSGIFPHTGRITTAGR
jgi:hypothetical protein